MLIKKAYYETSLQCQPIRKHWNCNVNGRRLPSSRHGERRRCRPSFRDIGYEVPTGYATWTNWQEAEASRPHRDAEGSPGNRSDRRREREREDRLRWDRSGGRCKAGHPTDLEPGPLLTSCLFYRIVRLQTRHLPCHKLWTYRARNNASRWLSCNNDAAVGASLKEKKNVIPPPTPPHLPPTRSANLPRCKLKADHFPPTPLAFPFAPPPPLHP